MSTPKFLTWSKGQSYSSKKTASSGIVPIPIECICFKGMDYERHDKRSSKLKRRPIPLEFDPDVKSEHSNSNSFALHDAAIKSATTLMTVMNDVLKSPHMNAHFLSAHQPGALQPIHGRPRSRTAPSTPFFEAPPMEPVELPGPFPVLPMSHHVTRSSMDGVASSKHISLGHSIERPHSSPQPSSHTFQDDRKPALMTVCSATNVRTLHGQPQHERRRSASKSSQIGGAEATMLAPEGAAILSTGTNTIRGPPYAHNGYPSTEHGLPDNRGYVDPRTPEPAVNVGILAAQDGPLQRVNTKALLEQISVMRRSHDAYISCLKLAHDREVESHKSYITFLESCASSIPESQEPTKRGLTLDTSHIASKGSGPLSMNVSASTSLQSLDSSLETQRRTSVESASAEAEALKRKLSLCRKTQSEIGDVKRERDQFRETSDRSERRIGQLKDIVRKSKDNEKALRNKIHGLEDALLAANIARLDALEGYHEACEQVRRLHDKQLVMIKERDEAAVRLASLESDRTRAAAIRDEHADDPASGGDALKHDALCRQLEELRSHVSERDSRISRLEAERGSDVPKSEAVKLEKQLATALAVRDQYNALLHAELRRQSKIITLGVPAAPPQIEDGAAAAVAEKLKSKPGSENVEKRVELLEKELKHCFQEIILYKLDIRGYRKDLKEANSKISILQASTPRRPETPDSIDNHIADNKASPGRRPRGTSGLGISLRRPSTPTRPETSSLVTPQQRTGATASPSPAISVKTPLELHKKLPKPPPSSQDPSPRIASSPQITILTRAETLRSLSDSIISSYAKRATPEQHHGVVPPLLRGHSSDPPRTGGLLAGSHQATDAIAVPISRYTSDMLKTPSIPATGVAKA